VLHFKIFESADSVYIAAERYHDLTGETKETTADGGIRFYYAECKGVINSLALFQEPENHYQQMWRIVVKGIHDDGELDSFIKSRYRTDWHPNAPLPPAFHAVHFVWG
jgi:hypothetical protein